MVMEEAASPMWSDTNGPGPNAPWTLAFGFKNATRASMAAFLVSSRGSSPGYGLLRSRRKSVHPKFIPATAAKIATAPTICIAPSRWPYAQASTMMATIG